MTKNKTKSINPTVYFFICLVSMICLNTTITNYVLNNLLSKTNNLKWIDIAFVKNTGAAFSSFQHSTILLIVLSIIAIIFLLYELFKRGKNYSLLTHFYSAMLMTGIICNTYERIIFGYVRDFISLKFVNFPIFNFSDILINFGVLAIMYLIITKKYLKND